MNEEETHTHWEDKKEKKLIMFLSDCPRESSFVDERQTLGEEF